MENGDGSDASEQDWYISRTHGGVSHTGMREGRAVRVADHQGARRRAGSRGEPAVSVYDYGAADCRRFAAGSARSRNFYLRGRTAEQRGTGDGAARRLLPKIDYRRRHDVGARSLVPRNFRSAPARGNGAGGRARMGLRADAHGRLPGVRRKSEDWRGGLPALQRDLGRGESGEARIRPSRGGHAIEREWRAVCRKEIAGLNAGKKKEQARKPALSSIEILCRGLFQAVERIRAAARKQRECAESEG